MHLKNNNRKAPKHHGLSLRECTALRKMCDCRIAQLQGRILNDTGTTWPLVWLDEIDEVKTLFKKLTGFPLDFFPQ